MKRRLTLALVVLLAACQGPSAENARPQELVVDPNDPCATNLGALVENLIVFYAVKHRLPENLSEISMTSVSGKKISLVCPATGKPYVYLPRGLYPPQDVMPVTGDAVPLEKRSPASILVLYDQEAAHPIVKHIAVGKDEYDLKQIVRYGIVYRPVPPGEPASMSVSPIEDTLMRMYLIAPQPAAGTALPEGTGG